MFTLTHADRLRPISDLAADLTDQTLELLSRAGVWGDSVAMELETWQALADELEREYDFRVKGSIGGDFHLAGVVEQAIPRAALRVAHLSSFKTTAPHPRAAARASS